jgi:hypothetical protein
MTSMEWQSLGLLELSALPTIGERWVPWVRQADVLLVDGGDATYLWHWMRESGLADLLPSLPDTVWVGVSAGSMVMTPRIGPDFVEWPSAPDDCTLGLVDFSIFPAPGRLPDKHPGCRRAVGRRNRRPGLRHRRADGHQGDRRHRRGRLRGALAAVPLTAAADSDGRGRSARSCRCRARRGLSFMSSAAAMSRLGLLQSRLVTFSGWHLRWRRRSA